MTSAKFSGFLTPSPVVSVYDQSIVLKSREPDFDFGYLPSSPSLLTSFVNGPLGRC